MKKVKEHVREPATMPNGVVVIDELAVSRAKQMLGLVSNNYQQLHLGLVNRYASEMKAGRWIAEHGSPIVLNKKGELIDGRHRLAAVVKSGVSMRSVLVVTNSLDATMADATQAPFQDGLKRKRKKKP